MSGFEAFFKVLYPAILDIVTKKFNEHKVPITNEHAQLLAVFVCMDIIDRVSPIFFDIMKKFSGEVEQ